MQFEKDVGTLAEDELQEAVEAAFSADFVFRSPQRIGGKEVTDVLVLFDDVCIVIESKAQATEQSARRRASEPLSWADKSLSKAAGQIGGAVKAIRSGRIKQVENETRGTVPFDSADFKYIYGLVILHHRSEAYDALDLCPALGSIDAVTQVLSFRDFWNLCHFLDTPVDLINYLEHRPEVLVPTLNPRVHEEAPVFGYYFEHLEEVLRVRAEGRGDEFTMQDFQLYADEFRRVVSGEHPHVEAGHVIDRMIERAHDLDPELRFVGPEGDGISQDSAAYSKIAARLGGIPRVRRIALGQRFLRVAQLAEETGESTHDVSHSPRRSDCMVFVASPLNRSERAQRSRWLFALTTLAKAYHEVNVAIGIATEAGSQMGSSYDMVFLEGQPTSDEGVKELGRQVFGDGDGAPPLMAIQR